MGIDALSSGDPLTPPRARILIVDDDRAVRTALRVNLDKAGYHVHVTASVAEARQVLSEEAIDLVLSDVMMPGGTGMDLLASLRQDHPSVDIILMTGHGSVGDAVSAIKQGASDYIIKPIKKAALLHLIERCLREKALLAEVQQLRAEAQERYGFDNIIGSTEAIQRVFELVAAVAESTALVLLTGPTGTGKELLAHAIHYRSPRREKPFVAVNCAALPHSLLESELFGHERGAFTGAVRRHPGKFEQASGGTLLLDEIGEIPLSTQVKLLRVLESGTLQRVGGQETIHVDVRVIAATNRNLRQEVRLGRFREDLYYRLNVFHIPLPSLLERREDIPLLSAHFIKKYNERHGRQVTALAPHALQRLMSHDWPGNIRELEHVIERAVIVSRGDVINTIDLPESEPSESLPVPDQPSPSQDITTVLHETERQLIITALRSEKGVQARAARRLGISRSNLSYRIKKLNIVLQDITYE